MLIIFQRSSLSFPKAFCLGFMLCILFCGEAEK